MSGSPILFTHWGAYQAQVEAGRLARLDPVPEDPEPSPIGQSIPEALGDALRIRQPMVRAGWLAEGPASRGRRGAEAFVPVSWERATRLVAGELRRVVRDHGNSAIFGGSYGWASAGRFHHAQSQLHRFLNLCGGYTRSVNTHSYAAAEVLLPHLLGTLDGLVRAHTPWSEVAAHTALFVAFGGVPLKNTQVAAGGVVRHGVRQALKACRAGGVRFLNVSPLRTDVPPELDAEWMPLRPNTDTALMLALCHTLLAEGLHDRAFLDRYCVGFAPVAAYLAGEPDGQPKDADWAAAISGIDAATIRALARRMAAARTMISVAWSLQRADHGEQPLFAALTLAAMLGQIGLPGGGIGYGYGGSNRIGLGAHGFAWPALPQGENPVRDFIPLGRLAEMLLHPGTPFTYDGGTYAFPDIRLVYWAGGNPFHHQSDLNRLVEAWRRPETVVVHEPWWNPLARHADIVLPCTTSAERNDLGIANDEAHLIAMKRLIAPVAQSRSDHDILAGIAAEMGFAEAFTEGRDEMHWVRHLYAEAQRRVAAQGFALPAFEEFWAIGRFRLPPPNRVPNLFEAFRADPEAAPLATPSGRIELFSERIAGFRIADCPGHAAWIPPAEWLGAEAARGYPLHLLSNQPRLRLHSQYDNGRMSRAAKVAGREPIFLNPEDAAARGIADRSLVRVRSARGACLAGAVLTEALTRGVVQLATGAWFDPDDVLERGGNPNVLTLDKGSSGLAQAPVAQTVLVEVEPWPEAPPTRAFDPPDISAA